MRRPRDPGIVERVGPWALVALVVLLLLPQASGLELSVPEWPDQVMPVSGNPGFTAQVRFECPIRAATRNATADLETVSSPDWLTVTPEMPQDVAPDPEACERRGGQRRVNVSGSLVADDPGVADRSGNVTFRAVFEDQVGRRTATANRTIRPGYYAILGFSGQTAVRASPGTPVEIPLTIANEGNGRTRVTWEVRTDDGLDVETPDPVRIRPAQVARGDNERTVVFEALAHAEPADGGPLHANVTAKAAWVEEPGQIEGTKSETVVVLVRTLVEKVLPGPGPVAGLALLFASAWALKRKTL